MKKKIEKPQREKREENEKRLKRFDPILKEIFSKAAGKIISIATGEQIHQELEDITAEIEFVKSLRPDMIFRAGEKIFHIEIQVQQDKTLPKRMLIYSIGIEEKFGKEPVQIVLFVGKGKPPPSYFKSEFKTFKFKVVDMKKINPDRFIKSDKPEEVIVGILAGKLKDKPQIIERVKKRIVEIVKRKKLLNI
jgi:hydroxymethylpyrimidine pyrophosphatase-like HAD family hydrolase